MVCWNAGEAVKAIYMIVSLGPPGGELQQSLVVPTPAKVETLAGGGQVEHMPPLIQYGATLPPHQE